MEDLSECTVLIVDDTETNVDILVDTLGEDYDIAVAMDGESALEVAEEDSPDLILLDIMMPGMDGYEVCKRLKDNPETAAFPVIFLSALTEADEKQKDLKLGAVDFLTKPFNPSVMQDKVKQHITAFKKI